MLSILLCIFVIIIIIIIIIIIVIIIITTIVIIIIIINIIITIRRRRRRRRRTIARRWNRKRFRWKRFPPFIKTTNNASLQRTAPVILCDCVWDPLREPGSWPARAGALNIRQVSTMVRISSHAFVHDVRAFLWSSSTLIFTTRPQVLVYRTADHRAKKLTLHAPYGVKGVLKI